MPFLPAQGSLPGPFQWGGEHGPVPPASPQALPLHCQLGCEDLLSSSPCTSPQTTLEAEDEASLPRIVHAGGFVFYVNTVHFYPP